MTLPLDALPQGAPHAIGAAAWGALWDELSSVALVLDNPARSTELQEGARILFIEDVSDRRVEEKGGQQKREYTFNLGVISRASAARTVAHGDYRLAKRLVRDSLAALHSKLNVISGLREGDVIYRIENVDVGGSLVLGTFSIQYRDPS